MTPTEHAEHLTRVYGYRIDDAIGVALVCECGWVYRWGPDFPPQVPEIQQARADHFAELFFEGRRPPAARPRPTLAPAPEGFVQGRDDPGDRP